MKQSKNNEIKIVDDSTFSTGFNVMGYSSVTDGRNIVTRLDYNGLSKESNKPLWYMAQWWTPYNLKDATYDYLDGKHIYKTPSRTISINPANQGYLQIALLGSVEYSGVPRKTISQSWPHALIEQTFTNQLSLTNLEKLIVRLEVSVDYCHDLNQEAFDPSLHAAQLLWYFTIVNEIGGKVNSLNSGVDGDFLWFGIPIFDSRYRHLEKNAFIDQGSPGTTNKLIYSLDSSLYLDDVFVIGKVYKIDMDILPYLKEAFIYAQSHNALVNCRLENMKINYFNFGWELPGMYDVSATIRNMDIVAIQNEKVGK